MSPPVRRSFAHRAISDWRSASERGSIPIQDIHGRRCSTLSAIATLSTSASPARHGLIASVCTADSVIVAIVSGDEMLSSALQERGFLAVGRTGQLVECDTDVI